MKFKLNNCKSRYLTSYEPVKTFFTVLLKLKLNNCKSRSFDLVWTRENILYSPLDRYDIFSDSSYIKYCKNLEKKDAKASSSLHSRLPAS